MFDFAMSVKMELYVATFNSPGENRKQEWNNLNY